MSNTTKHKVKGKFNNGILQKNEIPLNVIKMWNRHNFEIGYFRHLKKNKIEKQLNKEIKKLLFILLIALILASCASHKYNSGNNYCGQNERNTPR